MMNSLCETIEGPDGWKVDLYWDDDRQNPRTEWDHAATMVCSHSRHDLGDEQVDLDTWINEMIGCFFPDEWDRHYDLENSDRESDRAKADILYNKLKDRLYEHMEIMPLYLYDHSGITMSTGRFSCPWDSGQVGIIYMTREQILKQFGGKLLTKKKREQARDLMQAEVEEYDQYLTGDVYGYVVTDPLGNDVDSCWGFYGLSWARQEAAAALEHATSTHNPKGA